MENRQSRSGRYNLNKICSSRKEIILRRSLAEPTNTLTQKVNKSLIQEDIIEIISDDDDGDEKHYKNDSMNNKSFTQSLSNSFPGSNSHQNDDEIIRRLDKEMLNNANANVTSLDSVNSYKITPPKKRKIEILYKKISKDMKTTKESSHQHLNNTENIAESDSKEIVEFGSISSNNPNIRLKTNSELSSEFIVSSSSKSTQPLRPKLKNTLSVDSFERYLADLSKKYPEMNYKERVLLWDFSTDVSDVEDYTPFTYSQRNFDRQIRNISLLSSSSSLQKPLKKIQIENRNSFNIASRVSNLKINSDINCNETTNRLKEENKHLTSKAETVKASGLLKPKVSITQNIRDNNSNDENILMSVNKKSKKNHRNNKMVLNIKNSKNMQSNLICSSSQPVQLSLPDKDNSTFRRININPEIDKMRIIQLRTDYKQDNTNKIRITNNNNSIGNKKDQFKIPNIPLRYTSSSPTPANQTSIISSAITTVGQKVGEATQKEEFYKYLGLETKSPNSKTNKNNGINNSSKRDKISPGRVTRLQRGKIAKLIKFGEKQGDNHQRSRCISEKNIEIDNTELKNNEELIFSDNLVSSAADPKIKTFFSQSFSSPLSLKTKQKHEKDQKEIFKPKRSCSCVFDSNKNSKTIALSQESEINNQTKFANKVKGKSTNRKRTSTRTSVTSKSTTIESVKSNSLIIMRHSYKDQATKNLDRDDSTMKTKFVNDFSTTIPQVSLTRRRRRSLVLTLKDESKINPIAEKLYKKLIKILEESNSREDKIVIQMRNFKEGIERNQNKGETNFELNKSPKSENAILEMQDSQDILFKTDNVLNSLNSAPILSRLLLQEKAVNHQSVSETTNFVLRNSDIVAPSCSYSSVFNVNDLKNNFHNQQANVKTKTQRKLKLYQKIIKDRQFLKFLANRQLKISRKIYRPIKRFIKSNERVLVSENKLDNSIIGTKRVIQAEIEMEIENETMKSNNAKEILKQNEIKQKTDVILDNLNERETQHEKNKLLNNERLSSSSLHLSTITQNYLTNPLSPSNGNILHIYYDQELLIVVQELLVSFWKYSRVTQMMGKTQEWVSVGECKRKLHDYELPSLYKNRLCISDTNPLYIEIKAREFPSENIRKCNMASVYVNVYHYNEWKASGMVYSVQLDTIRGLASDICYTSITNSRYFVICWKQEGVLGAIRTGICKYALTPDLDTLASIREFKTMRHIINHLECINDDKLVGFGQSQVTIWDHRTGDILTNFDLEMSLGINLGSVLASLDFENYLFLYQLRSSNEDDNKDSDNKMSKNVNQIMNFNNAKINENKPPELKIIALTLTHQHPKFRLVCTHQLPLSFRNIKSSICNGNYLIATAATTEDEFLLLPNQPENIYFMRHEQNQKQHQHQNYQQPPESSCYRKNIIDDNSGVKRFYTTSNTNFVEVTNDILVVKTIHHYLLNFTT